MNDQNAMDIAIALRDLHEAISDLGRASYVVDGEKVARRAAIRALAERMYVALLVRDGGVGMDRSVFEHSARNCLELATIFADVADAHEAAAMADV